MKKNGFILILLLLSILSLTGCGQTQKTFEGPVKTMLCESSATQGDVKIKIHYEVTYQGEDVTYVKTKQVLTSTNTAVLEGYEKAIRDMYKKFDGIDDYNYEVKKEDQTLTSTVSIDYKKVDTDKLLKADDSGYQLIKNGKIKLEDIKEVYESVGATCKGA